MKLNILRITLLLKILQNTTSSIIDFKLDIKSKGCVYHLLNIQSRYTRSENYHVIGKTSTSVALNILPNDPSVQYYAFLYHGKEFLEQNKRWYNYLKFWRKKFPFYRFENVMMASSYASGGPSFFKSKSKDFDGVDFIKKSDWKGEVSCGNLKPKFYTHNYLLSVPDDKYDPLVLIMKRDIAYFICLFDMNDYKDAKKHKKNNANSDDSKLLMEKGPRLIDDCYKMVSSDVNSHVKQIVNESKVLI